MEKQMGRWKRSARRSRRIELVAETIARFAPDAFSSTYADCEPCEAKWPEDWGGEERTCFRFLARKVIAVVDRDG